MIAPPRKWLRFSKWWLLVPAVPILIVGGFVGLLWLSSYDHTEKVGKGLVFDSDGQLNGGAFAGALGGRFPVGSPEQNLRLFVKSMGGSCGSPAGGKGDSAPAPGSLGCTIPLSGTICVVSYMEVEVTLTSGDKIGAIHARRASDYC